MTDRAKTIKALECCVANCKKDCPYWGHCHHDPEGVSLQFLEDALELLREQEPTEYIDDGPDFINGTIARRWKCKACGQTATNEEGKAPTAIRYCFRCGKAVKWDDA